jgi:hypothetical protein
MLTRSRLTLDSFRGFPGCSKAARVALVEAQPVTVRQALCTHGVGRRTLRRLLALGLLTDPEGALELSYAQLERALRRPH